MEYDDEKCISAGALRSIGFKIDEKIPDCAWIPKRGIKIETVISEKNNPHQSIEVGMMKAVIKLEITEPFVWYGLEIMIPKGG